MLLVQKLNYFFGELLKRLLEPVTLDMLYHDRIVLRDAKLFHIDRKIGDKEELPAVNVALVSYHLSEALIGAVPARVVSAEYHYRQDYLRRSVFFGSICKAYAYIVHEL